MSQQTCFIAFGTFGNPNGFKQTFFIGGNADIAKSIKTFDLKTDAIQLFPRSKIYAVRKELINGHKAISYSIYTYAKEQNSDRGGTFIGSSILYVNNIAEENNTIACLNEFHEKLISKNVQNDVISVAHSDQFIVSKPSQYEKLTSSVKEMEDLNFTKSANKNLVVYSDTSSARLQQLFKEALPLLDVYDVIYFTSGKEVAEFVHQKSLFLLVQMDGFEQEISKLQDEKKQRVQSLVTEYETEKERLEEDKKRVLSELKEQITANEKIHGVNKSKLDEAKQEFNVVTQKYEGYEKKITEAIVQLTSGKKPDMVRRVLTENKRIFIESIHEQKQPVFINNIPKLKAVKTDIKPGFKPEISTPESVETNHRQRKHKEYRLDKFKIASFVLLLLWMGTLGYFLFFTGKEVVLAEAPEPDIQTLRIAPPAKKPPVIPELNPRPNGKLSETAMRTVLKHIKPHASADSVVKVIFDNNADEVKRYYATQKESYKKYLIEHNEEFFEKKDSTFYLTNDTLAVIPNYRVEL